VVFSTIDDENRPHRILLRAELLSETITRRACSINGCTKVLGDSFERLAQSVKVITGTTRELVFHCTVKPDSYLLCKVIHE